MARVLGEAAVGASKTNTFLGAFPAHRPTAGEQESHRGGGPFHSGHRLVPAVRSPGRFRDLGSGHYDSRVNPERKKRNHIRELEALGYKTTLEPAA
jgi:hypothetical protein